MRPTKWLLIAAGLAASVRSSNAGDPAAVEAAGQGVRQRQSTAAVEQAARRATTSLRILTYQKLDPTAEQRVVGEVAGSLKRLSREEMAAVLAHLESAARAPDEAAATSEQREAYQKHREVVATLRGLLFQLDSLGSLDEAAARFSAASKAQFALHQRALRADAAAVSPRQRGVDRKLLNDEREQQGDAQADVTSELTSLLKQLAALKPKLTAEQRTRLDQADAAGRTAQLLRQAEAASQAINGKNFRGAAEAQLKVSRELQAIAAALAATRDELSVLKETRVKLDEARRTEERLRAETVALKETKVAPNSRQEATRDAAAAKLADQQGAVEFETREARKGLEKVSPELAARLTPAESEMRRAEEDLREAALPSAKIAEENTVEKLAEVVAELDQRIADAERAKTDPLTATQKAAEAIGKLIEDQKAARSEAEANADRPEKLAPAAGAQGAVAADARDLAATPRPENAAVEKQLREAAEQADAAAKALDERDAAEAAPKQAAAVAALEAAKKGLEQQAAAIQERRDDIARLDEAKKELGELAGKEQALAEAAKADGAKAGELAKQQGELTPPTKDLADRLKEVAPDAAAKAGEAAARQAEAKDALAQNQPKPGAAKADEAAKKLAEASAAVEKKRADLQAKEVADQAALTPNQVDPAEAARQIAKALERSNKAADAAKQAADNLGPKPMQGEPKMTAQELLAELQKGLAAKAKEAGRAEAAKTAADAAARLEAGDIAAAVADQKRAAEALRKPAGDLAKEQDKLREATEALQRSAAATAQAQTALTQAQANAPKAVKPQLDEAAGQLGDAAKQLAQGQPTEANRSQGKAAEQLGQALAALNAAAQAMGEPTAKPGEDQQAQADATPDDQPGDKPSDKPGEKPGDKPGDKPQDRGNGDYAPGARPGGGAAAGANVENRSGRFIDLQKIDRDRVRQNAEAAFPAEFRELIKQYYMNLQKPARPAPAAPPRGEK